MAYSLHTHMPGEHTEEVKLLLAKLTPGGLPPYKISPNRVAAISFTPAVLKVLLLYIIGKSFFCTIK